jgi:putative intracellular protease/amidase
MGLAVTSATMKSSAAQEGAQPTVSAPKGTVLVIGSNARVLQLKGGGTASTGNYLNETIVPMQASRAAGYDLVVATPDGTKPPLDARSVGASHFGGDEAAFQAALDFFEHDSSFQDVQTLRSIIDGGLERFAGFYVPGGHAPITDLATNAELGVILRHAHERSKPTALLCHGPIAVLSALDDARSFEQALIADETAKASATAKDWQYKGYRMTIFSNSEEKAVEANVFGAQLLYSVADALALAGGNVENGEIDYDPFVVVDRELITGQNPRSDHKVAAHFVEALDAGL